MSSAALLNQSAVRLLALALPLIAAPAMYASAITYNVTLSPTSGSYGGSGTINLTSAPTEFGISTFSQANGTLQNLSFTIGNQTFSLAGDPSATVEFLDGKVLQHQLRPDRRQLATPFHPRHVGCLRLLLQQWLLGIFRGYHGRAGR